MGAKEVTRRSWLDAMAVYRHPRVIAMLFLGFSAGLPFPMVFSTLSAWLRDFGIDRATIGFFAWIGLTYSVKFLWAPVVDRLRLPLLGRWLGKRRSWMLLAQAGLVPLDRSTSIPTISRPLVPIFSSFHCLQPFSTSSPPLPYRESGREPAPGT